LEIQTDPSLSGLFHAISFQIAGIAIALCVPIIATALFTVVWGDATLQSQVANIKDAAVETRNSHAYEFISKQPFNLLRLMNLVLALALAASQFSILFGG